MVQEQLWYLEDVIGELAVRPRTARQHVVQPILGYLAGEPPRRAQDAGNPRHDRFRRQHLMAFPFETRELGDGAEVSAVRPFLAAGNDGHELQAQGLQLPKAPLVLEHVDGFERDGIGEQEFLGFETAGAARLPVDLQGFVRACCRNFAQA